MRLFRNAGVGVIAGLVLLAGCSSATTTTSSTSANTEVSTSATATKAAATNQSVAEACTALGATMTGATSALQTAMTQATSDPAKAAKAIQEFSTALDEAMAPVTNEKVRTEGEKAIKVTNKLAKALTKLADKPTADTVSAASTALTNFRTEFTTFAGLCS